MTNPQADEAPRPKENPEALPNKEEEAALEVFEQEPTNDDKQGNGNSGSNDKEAEPNLMPEQAPVPIMAPKAIHDQADDDNDEASFMNEKDFEESNGAFDGTNLHNDDDDVDDFEEYHNNNDNLTTEQREEIAKREHKAVLCLRIVVLLVLLFSAVAVILTVYFYMRDAEQKEFEDKFDSDAIKIYDEMKKTMDHTLGATDSFASNLVNYARNTNQTWPFVAMKGFGVQAAKLLKLSKCLDIRTFMIVQPNEQGKWEREFVPNNLGWIEETLALQRADPDNNIPMDFEYDILPKITGLFAPMKEPSPLNPFKFLAPGFYSYPLFGPQMVPPYNGKFLPPVNFESGWVTPETAGLSNFLVGQGKAMITPVTNVVRENATELEKFQAQRINDITRQIVGDRGDSSEPVSGLAVPIYDYAETVDAPDVADPTKRPRMVALMGLTIFWFNFLRDILPEGNDGIVVVIEDGCAPAFTYRIDGPRTFYLGVGDLHDTRFDDMGQTRTLQEILIASSTNSAGSYSGLPIDEKFCPKIISIYPSSTTEDEYITDEPIRYAVLTGLVFLFCSFVFISYDCLVARRQRIVMGRAIASGAIVSSLFPEKVKNQLYKEKENEKKLENAQKKFGRIPNGSSHLSDDDNGNQQRQQKAIADLYEETTIFFADIVGFTSWSAKQTPDKIFQFLEALYGRFDKAADRRKVFKVETIGDSYVAVTGIPEAQPDHAVIMTRFARDAVKIVREVTHELADTLGEETTKLDMRVGLNSGPTTAGVLRGKNGRFQLFGDTVNTASRMESTGVAGKIQVSQSTADALHAKGKGHWIVPREEKVVAKGKGEMQTYFVDVAPGAPISATSYNSGAPSGGASDHSGRDFSDEME